MLCSIAPPSTGRFRPAVSDTYTTQCGLPMETQVIRTAPPFTSTSSLTTGFAKPVTGIFSGASSGAPMSTVSRPGSLRTMCFTPESVSTSAAVPEAYPWRNRYSATQRTPFPHILPSLPSALNMRIFASAVSEGQMRMTPSPPTPLCRSESVRASSSGASTSCLKQSM